MAGIIEGLFTDPNSFRNERLDNLMNLQARQSQMGGSYSDLLGQVAAQGNIMGQMGAEAAAGMFGMKTAEEAKAIEEQKVAKGMDVGNVDSLTNAITRLKELGNMDAAFKLEGRRDALVAKKTEAEQEAQTRESVATYLESKGSTKLAESVRNGLPIDRAMAAVKPIEVGGALVSPDTLEVLIPAKKKPKTTYTLLSDQEVAELAKTNSAIDTSFAYQRDSDGKLIAMAKTDVANKYGTIPSGMELVEEVKADGRTVAYLQPLAGSQQAKDALAAAEAKRSKAQNTQIKTSTVNTAIDNARKILEDENSNATGFKGALMEDASKVPFLRAFVAESDRNDLVGYMNTIRANIGFNELKAMKQESSTGASGLGQLAIQEMLALQSTLGNLDLNQDRTTVVDNLDAIQDKFEMAATRMANEYTDEELRKYGLDYLAMYRENEETGVAPNDIINSVTIPESIASKYDIDQTIWDQLTPEQRQILLD